MDRKCSHRTCFPPFSRRASPSQRLLELGPRFEVVMAILGIVLKRGLSYIILGHRKWELISLRGAFVPDLRGAWDATLANCGDTKARGPNGRMQGDIPTGA